jgi:hypothetical protein
MGMLRHVCALFVLVAFTSVALAKNEPAIVLTWPVDKPALKLTFEKFRETGSYAGQSSFVSDVTVKNLTDKQIPRVLFTVYFLDKNKVRVGDRLLQISELEPGQSAKIQFQFNAVGVPVSLSLSSPSAKTTPLRIISVPAGAKLKVDGQEAGTTPVMVRLTVGPHQLDLTKEGYAPGSTPLDVTADELPGGSITVELGGLSRDTVELRDGSVVLGDVVSVSMTQVTVRVDGKELAYDRNQVKKIMLVERQITQQAPATQSTQEQPHQ